MAEGGLRLEAVSKRFDTAAGTLTVLHSVSLAVAPGESVSIVGPSGSGKSTLLHLIGGLDRPTSGRVTVDGLCPHELGERELATFRNRRVGFVFQEHYLLPQLNVLQNVLLPVRAAAAADAPAAATRARALLDRVGLLARLGHRPAELSGGERQRAAIARALINRPRLLLCDEPTGNLDRATAFAVGDLLFELHQAGLVAAAFAGAEPGGAATLGGGMLVIVTHSAELAARCDRRLELRDGALVAGG